MLILRWDGEIAHEQPDELVEEEPLEIRIQGRAISVTMRTPGHDADLAAGFLLTEGIIHRKQDVIFIKHCAHNQGHNVLNVVLAPGVSVDFRRLTRHVFASSSCGLCGKTTIESVHGQFPPVRSDIVIEAEVLATLPGKMRAAQATFERTGGLHAAALFDPAGRLIVLREDVGRHNAVDKVIGDGVREGRLPLAGHVLMVSGRASFELTQKAAMAGIPVLAAVSAPSSLAVELAREVGITLVGFLRGDGCNVYTHQERIQLD
jgi:FdhD protein